MKHGVDSLRVGALKPLHPRDQIRLGRFQQQVVVIGQEDEGMNLDWIEFLRPSQDTDDDRFQFIRGLQQKATLYGAAGHLHEGAAVRDEAYSPCHAL